MSTFLVAANLASHWIQSGLLAGIALLALRVLRVKEPRLRLISLQAVLLLILLLPWLQVWRPGDELIRASSSSTIVATQQMTAAADAPGISASQPGRLAAAPGLVQAALASVVAGMALRLLWLTCGIFRLMRFSRRAAELPRPAVAGELETQIHVSPRYIQQAAGRGPWTFGFLRSTVALPVEFGSLAPAFQRAVVCHELLHAKRRDMAIAFAEELAAAMLWFHPWVWRLRARIRVAREQVVDRHVVTLIGDRDGYVRCLVEISGHDLTPHFSEAGAGMLRPRELRARVDAIFQEELMSRARLVAVTVALLAVVAATGWLAAWAMPLRTPYVLSGFSPTVRAQTAAETPRRQTKMSFAEYPADALEKGIRGTVMVAITVGPGGDVTTAAVVSGPEELRASAFKAAMGLQFSPGPSTTAMTIPVEYVLTGNFWGVRIGDVSANGTSRGILAENQSGPDATGAYRIGGSIRAPRRVHNVFPQYPAVAKATGVQGVVIIEARVDERGNVGDTRVLRSIPLLDEAALDAVKQWKYEPTLIKGAAVPVRMTVTVNFTARNSGSTAR